MANTREIRRRIKSVKNTRQITKAMELVAASKMKKTQTAATSGRPFAALMAQMLYAVSGRLEGFKHPFLETREIKTRGILLVSTNRGLCGGLNTNLFRLVNGLQGDVAYVSLGRKGTQYLGRTKRNLLADFPLTDQAHFSEISVAVEFLTEQYIAGNIDTIEVLYSRFVNTLQQEPTLDPILPLSSLEDVIERVNQAAGGSIVADDRPMILEPSANEILSELLPLYVKREIYQRVLEAQASEQSARMVAMKTAADNASKIIDQLTLDYNKARQAAITQEILEIAAASAANT
jgi:F-type H+-transporting ATPase subunit gamma